MKSSIRLLASVGLAALPAFAQTNVPISPVPASATARVAVVQVRVKPDHRDWTYAPGEVPHFTISVVADNEPIDNAEVTYQVGPELMPAPLQTSKVPLEGLVVDGPTMREPGFEKCIVTARVNGWTYRALGAAAFSPEKIVAYKDEAPDFDAFWQKGKDALSKIPVEARMTLLPDLCTDSVNVYHVSIRTVGESWKGPARIYGMLAEPKQPGKYPAVLQVPGAGVRPYFPDTSLASKGAIVLTIGIHGIPVNQPEEMYNNLQAGALNGYWLFNFDDPESYYYRRVVLSCLRANDYLTSRPDWDGKRLLVMGASQGGFLSVATAALDSRVTGLQVTHPALCDLLGELHGRAGGWPHPFMPNADGSASRHVTDAKLRTASYYDTVDFARRLKVPGFYIWGYNDETCPPTSTYAMYNAISAPKQLSVEFEQGHQYPEEQGRAIYAWVEAFLKLDGPSSP